MRKGLVILLIVVLVLVAAPTGADAQTGCTAVVQYDTVLMFVYTPPVPSVEAGEVLYNVAYGFSFFGTRAPWVTFDGTNLQPALSGIVPLAAVDVTCPAMMSRKR